MVTVSGTSHSNNSKTSLSAYYMCIGKTTVPLCVVNLSELVGSFAFVGDNGP